MRTFAYCCQSFNRAARQVTGEEPVTCPPLDASSILLRPMELADVIYLDLHGEPGDDMWYGDNGVPALTAEQVRELDLTGKVVFATNCYLADEDSPMMDALLDAGVQYVIGGDGKNWAGPNSAVYGATLLAKVFFWTMRRGMDPLKALAWAKQRVRLSSTGYKLIRRKDRVKASEDTLAFRAYHRPNQV